MRKEAMNPVLERYKAPESNVFLMTRFRQTEHHREISTAVQYAVEAFGLEFVRADDPNLPGSELWARVKSCLDACHYGVAVFEAIDETEFNPNIALELGYMRALNRDCLLLKEQRLRSLPSDLCGDMYKSFDCMKISSTVLAQTADWLKEIGARKRDQAKVVVFVSTGGTCRCAIAKAITAKLLARRKDSARIRVESRASGRPTLGTATRAGVTAVRNILGENHLSSHRARKAGFGFLFEADLILAMSAGVLEALDQVHMAYDGDVAERAALAEEIRRKTFLVTDFFGGAGDIEDPYVEGSISAYERCVETLRDLITPRLETLTSYLLREPAPNQAMKRTVAFGARRLSP